MAITMAPCRLLVVDDDNLQRMVTRKVGDNLGYETAGAACYEEAAILLREGVFHCMTLDIMLGKHSGVDVLRLMKELRSEAHIILISGSHEAITNMAMSVGGLAKLKMGKPLPKPLDIPALQQVLTEVRRDVHRRLRDQATENVTQRAS